MLKRRQSWYSRLISLCLIVTFVTTMVIAPRASYAQGGVMGLPQPGTMVDLSPTYVPVLIKGLKVHQDNPLAIDFIVDTGDSGLKLDQGADKQTLSKESEKMIKYFLAALTLPEKDVWVNLSPYEKDRIIPAGLGQTEMGRDMLAEDYILKQITASLIYPEKGIGKDFWDRVYKQAYQRFGTTQIPVNTFNKVWIVADRASVYENKDTAFVIESHLKVMLEQDYLSLGKHVSQTTANNTNDLGAQIVREVILPALEKEVNQGKNFANLRQIFYSLILAKWYKQTLKQAVLNQVYSNRNKVAGVDVSDKAITHKIYDQYLQAYQKGVFNFIKEDIDQATQQPLPRKYFSGGVVGDMALTVTHRPEDATQAAIPEGNFVLVVNSMNPVIHRTIASNDEGENLFGKEQRDSAIDAAMTSKDSYSISEIEEEVREFGVTVTDQYNEQLNSAIAFLREGIGPDSFKTVPTIAVVENEQKGFYTRFHKERGIIYIEKGRLNQLIGLKKKLVEKYGTNGDIDILAREFVYALSSGSDVERREMEFAYAYQKFPKQVIARFPSREALPNQVLGRITDSLMRVWNDKGKVDNNKVATLRTLLNFDDEILVSKNVSLETREFYRDILASAEDSLYKIGINALNGVIDLNQKIRLKEKDDQLNGTENIKAGMLAFAANPPTAAHTLIAMLKSMADNEFDVFFATITKGDYRKPALAATFPVRQAVTEELINHLFAGLIKVAPPLKIMNEKGEWVDEPGINGEEKIQEFFRLNKDAKSFRLGYVIGLDHYKSIKVEFEKITEENIKDYEFYVKKPGYKDLLLRFWDWMNQNMSGRKQFFDDLREASSPLDLLKIGAEFPIMDTVGKLFLIQDELKRKSSQGAFYKNFEIDLIKIGRAGESLGQQDVLRDRIAKEVRVDGVEGSPLGQESNMEGSPLGQESNIIRVLINTGIEHEVSATLLRNGIDDLIASRQFNFDYLRSMHLEVLQMAMGTYENKKGTSLFIKGPQLFSIWLRTASLGLEDKARPMFPREIETLIPSLRMELRNYRVTARQTLIMKINTILQSFYDVINVDEFEESRQTIVQVRAHLRGDPQQILKVIIRVQQGWVAYFDGQGHNVSKSINTEPIFDAQFNNLLQQPLTNVINEFFNTINDHTPVEPSLGYKVLSDKAMRTTPTGGIDFNANQLQLNVEKQGAGVGINFDPEMVKRFENGDFQGFVPVIINIRPIANIAPMLGLREEETELSKV